MARRTVALAGLVLLLAMPSPASAEPPACTRQAPAAASFDVTQWDWVTFEVQCEAQEKDLARVVWSIDGVPDESIATQSGEAENVQNGIEFGTTGNHYVRARGVNSTDGMSEPVLWVVHVLPYNGSTETTAALDTAGAGGAGFWASIDPLDALTAVVGAIVGVGGLALAVAQHRRRRAGGEDAAASSASIQQSVGSNTGTVIGQAGQVVVQAPAPSVPAGVLPHKQDLYLALARAHDALDGLPLGEAVLEARLLVADLMEKLAGGELPVREARRPAAAAISVVLVAGVPKAASVDALRAAERLLSS